VVNAGANAAAASPKPMSAIRSAMHPHYSALPAEDQSEAGDRYSLS
jgi:hypothetical protein